MRPAPPPDRRPWWMLPSARVSGAWWLAIAIVLLGLEYATGLHNQFPMVYVIPVSLAAWYSGRRPALVLAVTIPIAHLLFMAIENRPVDVLNVATAILRGGVIVFIALWFSRLAEHERVLHEQVRTLQGLLPICSFCKSIRNDRGEWEQLERYISRRSETQFSHGLCPSCQERYYGNLVDRERA